MANYLESPTHHGQQKYFKENFNKFFKNNLNFLMKEVKEV